MKFTTAIASLLVAYLTDAFTVPKNQPDGVYGVAINDAGVETHKLIAHMGNFTTEELEHYTAGATTLKDSIPGLDSTLAFHPPSSPYISKRHNWGCWVGCGTNDVLN